jgi:thiosulfate/3-mercaptopyruvate sulfurtransferase
MPVLDEAGAARIARSGSLLDARAGERYRGDVEPVDPAAGHIPGAISAPARGNVTGDGLFLRRAELERRFRGLGLPGRPRRPGRPRPSGSPRSAQLAAEAAEPGEVPLIGAYCGSGVNAAQEILALEIAGLPAALYVGSWSAWSADPSRPVATGPDPG